MLTDYGVSYEHNKDIVSTPIPIQIYITLADEYIHQDQQQNIKVDTGVDIFVDNISFRKKKKTLDKYLI